MPTWNFQFSMPFSSCCFSRRCSHWRCMRNSLWHDKSRIYSFVSIACLLLNDKILSHVWFWMNCLNLVNLKNQRALHPNHTQIQRKKTKLYDYLQLFWLKWAPFDVVVAIWAITQTSCHRSKIAEVCVCVLTDDVLKNKTAESLY